MAFLSSSTALPFHNSVHFSSTIKIELNIENPTTRFYDCEGIFVSVSCPVAQKPVSHIDDGFSLHFYSSGIQWVSDLWQRIVLHMPTHVLSY